jgi:class 3 adenylate cyclase/GAF domain-containing protein
MDNRESTIRRLRTEISALESRHDSQNFLIQALREQLRDHEERTGDDRRNQIFRRAAIDMIPDEEHREFSNHGPVLINEMGEALVALGSRLDHTYAEIKALSEVTERVNTGMFFDEVLDHVFENFHSIVPYDRIGVALIEESESGRQLVRAKWGRAEYHPLIISKGYAAVLEGSSLQDIAHSREPRILNDLNEYLETHPESHSTWLIVREGIRSSLTCPLVARDVVIGFIFFSSVEADTYQGQHIELFSQVAGELAFTLEKSRAYEDLYLRNEFIKKVFGQYVTNEVAEAVLSNQGPLTLGGERRKVTVLMADLRGFTPMSEKLSPEEVVDALNVFLGTMTVIVMRYGGSIDNFIGDALMAVFGVPVGKPDDAARAVACAVEMQNAMTAVNDEIAGRDLPTLAMGIGLSTGEVVAGNIGSEMRVKYSVIGATVNLAARIEGMASGGQVFASDATFEEVRAIVRAAGSLNVQLKGLPHPVPIHEIVGIGGDYDVDKSTPGDPAT